MNKKIKELERENEKLKAKLYDCEEQLNSYQQGIADGTLLATILENGRIIANEIVSNTFNSNNKGENKTITAEDIEDIIDYINEHEKTIQEDYDTIEDFDELDLSMHYKLLVNRVKVKLGELQSESTESEDTELKTKERINDNKYR